MTVQQLRKEIISLKTELISKYEPSCMLFIFDNGLTCEGLTAADVDRYEGEHPYTHVVRLEVEDMGVPDDY
jgi:hypothetical protein